MDRAWLVDAEIADQQTRYNCRSAQERKPPNTVDFKASSQDWAKIVIRGTVCKRLLGPAFLTSNPALLGTSRASGGATFLRSYAPCLLPAGRDLPGEKIRFRSEMFLSWKKQSRGPQKKATALVSSAHRAVDRGS